MTNLVYELVLIDYHRVYSAGEIMVVEETYGREQLGDGRKSSKWDVATKEYPTAADAVAAALERGLTPKLPYGYPDTVPLCDAVRNLLTALDGLSETPEGA